MKRWIAMAGVLWATACGNTATTGADKPGASDGGGAAADGQVLAGDANDAGATAADAAGDAVAAADGAAVDAGSSIDAPVAADVPPVDAGQSDTQKLLACLGSHCNDQLTACLEDTECATAVMCLGSCNGDTTCMTNCGKGLSGPAQGKLTSVAQCAVQQGCVQVIKSGKCGDGKCDLGEQLTCAQDCGTPSSVCGDGKCDIGEQLTCSSDCKTAGPACGDGKCDGPVENPYTCAKDCPAPKCGDGKCEAPWETALTCGSDCPPSPSLNCGDGTCDNIVENPYTCPKDCPAPKCGDGKCDTPWETELACAADCSPNGGQLGNVTTCVLKSCIPESTACSLDFTGCAKAVTCPGKCKDMTCVDGCGAGLSGKAADLFKALRDCIQANCKAAP